MVRIFFCIYRYWSLTEATSNINKNYIVTGIRFVKKSRVIHLEVEQARALPEGIKMYRLYLKLIFTMEIDCSEFFLSLFNIYSAKYHI